MAKSLRSMSESERRAAIARRIASKTMGLGYWAARGAAARLTKYAPDVAPVTSAKPDSSSESVPAVESDTQPRG